MGEVGNLTGELGTKTGEEETEYLPASPDAAEEEKYRSVKVQPNHFFTMPLLIPGGVKWKDEREELVLE